MAEVTGTIDRETVLGALLLTALLAFPLIAWALGEPYYVNHASRLTIVAMAASGLNLALGMGGMVSFGHAAFFGLGGYVAGISATHAFDGTAVLGLLPGSDHMPAIWIAAVLVSGAAALAIGAISLRTSGVYFIMITLAFAQMIYYFAVSWPAYGGEDGLSIYVRNGLFGLDTFDPATFFAISFSALLVALLVTSRVMAARFGAALTMARLDPVRLAAAGVEPRTVRLVAFTLSAMITGWAGALFADLAGFVSPAMLSWHRSGELMVVVILGGVGRLMGPVAGAILFVLAETVLGGWTDYWQFYLGLVLLAVVLFAKGGLVGLLAGPARHD